jgi:Glycosyl hydrolase family 26
MTKRLLTTCALLALLAGVLVPAALARPYLGVYGSRAAFAPAAHPVGHVIAAWGQGPVANILGALGKVPMLGIATGGLTPQAIAAGTGDSWLAEINQTIAAKQSLVYVRPMGEMDGHWNPYCAYNQNGTPRPAAFSTKNFRKAFARISILLHGGSTPFVNARLAKLGLPPVKQEFVLIAKSRLRVIWNPLGWADPDVPGNQPERYYPGDAYVDVVGGDVYKTAGNVGHMTALDKLYAAHKNKPFSIPEWGLNGVDDPGWVRRVADWIRAHPRTEVAVYFNGRAGSSFDLARKPQSRAAYARYVVPLGRAA